MNDDIADLRRHITFKRDIERKLPVEYADLMLAALDDGAAPDYLALLRAAQWPDPPNVTFHTAPRHAREVITTDGLRINQPGTGDNAFPDGFGIYASQPVGVYVGEKPDTLGVWSRWAEWDVWQVDVTGLPWVADEVNARCWCIEADITPDRLTLLTVTTDLPEHR